MRWSKRGVWQGVFEVLAAEADNEYAQIDSTILLAHQHSAAAKKGIVPKNVSVAPAEV
jgi:transposase